MICKGKGPDEVIDLETLGDPVLGSYYRLMRLKRLYRQGWLKRDVPTERCESVADHSFGTALLALLMLGPSAALGPPREAGEPGLKSPRQDGVSIDAGRAVLLALIHELGEAYAGDITPVDGVSCEEKRELERRSMLRALEGHPERALFMELWTEFEEGASPEARFVRELDRLEMGLQAALQAAEGYPAMEEFFDSARRTVREPRLRSLLDKAIMASKKSAQS